MTVTGNLPTNFVLIDHENVQPKSLSLLSGGPFQIYLFVGSKQTSVNIGLVKAMHELGPKRAHYIQVLQTRPNALDFHITYYLGVLASQNPNAYFHIISKDKGFDPLIAHLKLDGRHVARRDSIADIPVIHIGKGTNSDETLDAIVTNLKGRGQCKPRKEKTLKNTIKTMFAEDLSENEVNAVFNTLKKANYINLENNFISYNFPK